MRSWNNDDVVLEALSAVSATPTYSLMLNAIQLTHQLSPFFARMWRLLSKPPAATTLSVTKSRRMKGSVGQCSV